MTGNAPSYDFLAVGPNELDSKSVVKSKPVPGSTFVGINKKKRIVRVFHRNGVVALEQVYSGRTLHGRQRMWHRNGQIASEENYRHGLPHGLCRQWDEEGGLLGFYRMKNGTGIQRAWHDNGRLNMEISTVRGEFCGRNRTWLSDGTLISERYCLRNRTVSPAQYRAAALKDKTLPQYRDRPARLPLKGRSLEKRTHRIFVNWLLGKRNRHEAMKWLRSGATSGTIRSLGRFKRARNAAKCKSAKFVEELYRAGASEVIAPDIYDNKAGDQFADCLLVRLPKLIAKRLAIRKVCAQLRKRGLGAVQPDKDTGEGYLYLSLA